MLTQVVDEIEKDKERFQGQDISVIINWMCYAAIDIEIRKYAEKWYLGYEDALPKFKFRRLMIDEFKNMIMPGIAPLI